ncbi:pknD [Symbiodinium natans]|uniref:PknD protein n=1 Tax=Symbiodinium natans TaxID=878477 RepID=A0A812PCG8_9DINO|nr:pknD [Symbiodinium natans]
MGPHPGTEPGDDEVAADPDALLQDLLESLSQAKYPKHGEELTYHTPSAARLPEAREEDTREIAHPAGDEDSEPLRKPRKLSLQKKTVYPIDLLAGGWHQGNADQQLSRPYDVVRDEATGATYVSDMMNHRIQKWMPGSQVVETVAGGLIAGGGLDQLRFPRGIFLDTSGRLFVADSGNNRIVRWDIAAGASTGVLIAGELGVLYDRQGQIRGYESTCCRGGPGLYQLRDPHGVFVNLAGEVFIADTGNNRVQRVSGLVTTTIAGDLVRPEAVFATTDSFVYVADTGQHRVVKYALAGGAGTVVAGGNGIGTTLDKTTSPTGIHVDDSEQVGGVPIRNIYVVDTDNNRVAKIREDDGSVSLAAGGCLESPSYIDPCIEGGIHDPPRPHPDDEEALNPSYDNPPIYHFWGPSGLHINSGINKNITVADTLNHRVMVWYA